MVGTSRPRRSGQLVPSAKLGVTPAACDTDARASRSHKRLRLLADTSAPAAPSPQTPNADGSPVRPECAPPRRMRTRGIRASRPTAATISARANAASLCPRRSEAVEPNNEVVVPERLSFLRVPPSSTPAVKAELHTAETAPLTPLTADNQKASSPVGTIEFQRSSSDGSVLLRIPSRSVVLPEGAFFNASEASSLVKSFLEAPGAFKIPFSDQAVLEWLRVRGVYPFDSRFVASSKGARLVWKGLGSAVDVLQDNPNYVMPRRRAELLLESMKVSWFLDDMVSCYQLAVEIATSLVSSYPRSECPVYANEPLHQILEDLYNQPTPGPDLRSFVYQYARRHSSMRTLLSKLPRRLHEAAIHEAHCTPVNARVAVVMDLNRTDEAHSLERIRAVSDAKLAAATHFVCTAFSFPWFKQSQASFLKRFEMLGEHLTHMRLCIDFASIDESQAFHARALAAVPRPSLLALDLSLSTLALPRELNLLQALLPALPMLQELNLRATFVPTCAWVPPPGRRTEEAPPHLLVPLSALSQLRNLRMLDLSRNRIPTIHSLARLLQVLPTALEELYVAGEVDATHRYAIDAIATASALGRLTNLVKLDLSYKTLAIAAGDSSRAANAWVGTFQNLQKLRSLDISYMDLQDMHLFSIVQALPQAMRHLAMSGNYFKLGVVAAMQGPLGRMGGLEALSMHSCALCGGDVATWAPLLASLTSLGQLDLGGNGFSVPETKAVLAAVRALHKCRSISIT